jgi:mRNA interferase HigB
MNVITLPILTEFGSVYRDALEPLRAWYRQMRSSDYGSFADVRADDGSADWVKGFIVFNIGGNKFRLIVFPNFVGKRFYIEAVFTHAQYDQWRPE